jgi:8-demethyltetracenomycin C L-rhamnosyltransferase
MRVLFLTIPGVGHAFPAIPIAWALRAAGHDVLFATSGDGLIVEKSGLPVVDLRLGEDAPEEFARVEARHPEFRAIMNQENGRRLENFADVIPAFADLSAALAGPAVEIATAWRPDLIVYSPLHGAGLLAAAVIGVPAVELREGFGHRPKHIEMLYEHMAESFGTYGLPAYTSLDFSPPSMIDPADVGIPLRYVPFNGGSVVPDWLGPYAPPPARPRIGVTLGTVWTELSPIRSLLADAAGVDAEFVLALGDIDTSSLGPIPDNVRLAGWVPLSDLLPTCAGVVHHGSCGGTMSSLAAGVPQLTLGVASDSYLNGSAVVQRGVGFTGQPTRENLQRLVEDDAMRTAAREVAEEISLMPAPARVAEHLARL